MIKGSGAQKQRLFANSWMFKFGQKVYLRQPVYETSKLQDFETKKTGGANAPPRWAPLHIRQRKKFWEEILEKSNFLTPNFFKNAPLLVT